MKTECPLCLEEMAVARQLRVPTHALSKMN
jgi:hypothetical protein